MFDFSPLPASVNPSFGFVPLPNSNVEFQLPRDDGFCEHRRKEKISIDFCVSFSLDSAKQLRTGGKKWKGTQV